MPYKNPEDAKAYRAKNAQKMKPYWRARYLAQREAALAAARENYLRNREAKLAYQKNYAAANASKVKAYRARHLQENREKINSKQRQYRLENADHVRAQKRTSDAKHRRKHYAKRRAWAKAHPESTRASTKKYYESHKAYYHACVNKRTAIEKGAGVGTDRKAVAAFLALLKSSAVLACYWCGKKTHKGERHADHIFPLKHKGRDDVHNLCCACIPCNLSKNAKLPEEFTGQYELRFC